MMARNKGDVGLPGMLLIPLYIFSPLIDQPRRVGHCFECQYQSKICKCLIGSSNCDDCFNYPVHVTPYFFFVITKRRNKVIDIQVLRTI